MSVQKKAPQEWGDIKAFTIQISTKNSPELDRAIESLKQLAEISPERVQLFLDGLDSFVELVCFDVDRSATASTGEVRVLAQPSDRFLDFLAASGAVDG